MDSMRRRSLSSLCLFAAFIGLLALSFSIAAHAQSSDNQRGRKYKAPPQTARIEVTILRDANEKPVENAAVIFHLVGEKGNMELKSNEDGKAVIDVLPMGSNIRLQIIAKGFQTYGEDFKVDKPQMSIEVKMKRPGEQYSIYKTNGQAAEPAKDKSADAPKQPGASPQPQPK
jgi:hypothetical protein